VEEHFYLLWPPVLIWLARRVRSPRRLAAVVAAMALGSWALRTGLLLAGTDTDRLYYMLDTRADALLVGCALGVLHGAGALPAVPPGAARRALAAGALLVGAAWFALLLTASFRDTANHLWRFTFMAGTTALVVFCAVTAPDSLPSRVLGSRSLAGIGRISYGLYLWHYPIFFALAHDVGLSLGATLTLGTPLSLAAAVLSYYWVELPALRLKRRFV
jgi:peptidoglycan/LPS O-acetylase OafA/YrhL